jgi:molecular chaperone DnaJ
MSVTVHPFLERNGTDLHCEVPISFPQAAMGAEVEVPTLEGKVTVSVPAGTQPGKLLRLRGCGLPPLEPRLEAAQLKRMRGDCYVRVSVEVPASLTPRQRELLEEFAEESGIESSPATKSFMDKLRDFFD